MYVQISKIKKHITLLLLFSCACATTTKPLPQHSQNFDSAYQYKVSTTSASYSNLNAHDIKVSGQKLTIDSYGKKINLNLSDIQSIQGKSIQKSGNYKWEAAGIGALSGLAAGLAGSFSGNCAKAGDPGDCEALKNIGHIVFPAVGVLLGGGIGYGVGHFIPKKQKINIIPSLNENGKGAGLAVGSSF